MVSRLNIKLSKKLQGGWDEMKKINLLSIKKVEEELFTKSSLFEKVASVLRLNENFHRYTHDVINRNSELIVSPVQATLVVLGKINDGKIISKSGKEIDLKEVIGRSANLFLDGFYFNFYLSPRDKHYWRIPYDGKIVSTTINNGTAVVPIMVGLERFFPKIDFFEKAIKRNATIGSVFKTKDFFYAMIAVGSLNVNGIHVINKKSKEYKKGEVGGYFNIGSSMLLCFSEYPLKSLINIRTKVNIGNSIMEILTK